MKTDGKIYTAGIDSGSTSTDAVIMDRDKNIIGKAIVPTGAGATNGAKKALAAALEEAGINEDSLTLTVTTGYGRENISFGNSSVTEITCHAKGAHYLDPLARTVIDIGGQDSKAIRIDENGSVLSFVMNDKCAAGTGRFLDMMARTMELTLDEMGELGLHWKNDVVISNMCTVFAESEVISLIGQGEKKENIAFAVVNSIADKVAAQCSKMNVGTGEVFLTGGLCECGYLQEILEQKLGSPVLTGPECRYAGAIGAALCSRNI